MFDREQLRITPFPYGSIVNPDRSRSISKGDGPTLDLLEVLVLFVAFDLVVSRLLRLLALDVEPVV